MDTPIPFVPADACAVTLRRDDSGYWSVMFASHVKGMPWDDRMRATYDRLTSHELLDVVFNELASRTGIL